MEIFRGQLKKDELLLIPDSERELLVAVAHLQNEIRFLLRAVLWSTDFSSDNESTVHGQVSLSMFFTKLLAGKLREGWELLQACYFSKQEISMDFEKNGSSEALAALAELKRYFGKSNLLHRLRNDHSFHFSPTEIQRELEETTDDLDMYVEKDTDANTLYYFAEVLANRAAIKSTGLEFGPEALGQLNAEVTSVAGMYSRMNNGLIHYVLSKYKPGIWKGSAQLVKFEELPSYAAFRFPWFADTSDGLR